MKIDVIRVRKIPENWQLELVLRERDYERRQRLNRTPSSAFLYSVAFTLLGGALVLGLLFWRFYL
jgi:hypothetical protein